MGMTKYHEDNLKILEERAIMFEVESDFTIRATVNVTVTAPAPAKNTVSVVSTANNPVLIERVCRCCGEAFSMRRKTVKWYFEKGYYLPKHCPKCLAERKARKK